MGILSDSCIGLVSVTEPSWWYVNIGSGNGLVPSGNKPLAEPMSINIFVAVWCHYSPQLFNITTCVQLFYHVKVMICFASSTKFPLKKLHTPFICNLFCWPAVG